MSTDDRHSDHDLKAWLDGGDGVSAAYRETAHEQPPAALDRIILEAARQHAQPSAERWYAARKPYALAASVMIAIAGLSLYLGTLDGLIGAAERAQPTPVEAVEVRRLERAEAVRREADSQAEEEQRSASSQRTAFANRPLPAPLQTVSAADAPAAPIVPAAATNPDALALSSEAPAIVIDGPLLESIEADAAAAQNRQQRSVASALDEITVTGSRILRRDEGDLSYRDSRASWLDEIRSMASELDARSRLVTARRAATVLEEQLEEEIELFLEAYPDTDIDAELEP